MPKKDAVKSASKGRGLTPKQKRFVEEYLIDLNATQAAIRSGYSADTARQIGTENLSKPVIQEAIQKAQDQRSDRTKITQDEILRDLQELKDICLGRKSIVITDTLKNSQEGTVTTVDSPIFLFEPVSANKALELMGKHLGMFKDKVEVTGDVSNYNVSLTKDEFKQMAKELLEEV
ncbi:terminase small subunit [Gallibacterium salpingitidis]|uniref:terminase small subunit n=1 Tax=Gallibacterium salpingitidis TaxID=505341 RepID=UPI00266FE2A9|nr:terminase small subunit [Gallibacterium salpingitidis]WKT00519.1 terminase small subunit [Gallibacterium salpingitidis]